MFIHCLRKYEENDHRNGEGLMKELATKEQCNEHATTSKKLCENREYGKLQQKWASAKTFFIIKTNGCRKKIKDPVSCNPRNIFPRLFLFREKNIFNLVQYCAFVY